MKCHTFDHVLDLEILTNFLDIPLHNLHLVKLSWDSFLNALKEEVALHILQPLLLAHSLLLTH